MKIRMIFAEIRTINVRFYKFLGAGFVEGLAVGGEKRIWMKS